MAQLNQQAVQAADAAWLKELAIIGGLPSMPIKTGLHDNYPGLDPMGHFSTLDLDLADRMSKVEARMQFMPDSIRMAKSNIENTAGFQTLTDQMQRSSLKYAVAEGLLENKSSGMEEDSKKHLKHIMDTAKRDDSLIVYDMYVSQMEYLTGLKKTPPTKIEEQILKANHLKADEFALSQAGQSRVSNMPKLTVELADSANWEWQRQISQAYKSTQPSVLDAAVSAFKENNTKGIELQYPQYRLEAFAAETLKRPLDPFFQDMEAKPLAKAAGITRDHLIFIDGVSLSQRMKEQGNLAGDMNKKEWETTRNGLLASAIMTGHRVNLYRLDQDGKSIIPEPVPLEAKGHEPSPVNEPHFNAWQSFWAKRGFYKEKVAQLEQFNTVQQEKAIERRAISQISSHLAYQDTKMVQKETQINKTSQRTR